MTQRQVNNKKPCAKLRSKKLIRKVDHLTVQLEDVTSSIEVIMDAICNEDSTSKAMFKKYETESQIRFEDESNRYKEILSEEVENCTQVIHQKKMIGIEIEQTITDKVKEEKITIDRLDKIRMKVEDTIESFRKEWKRGEKEREKYWMATRLKEIQNRTLEALQPQVKKLLETHILELTREEEKFTSQEQCTRIEMERSFRKQISDYKSETEDEARNRNDEAKAAWMQKLISLQEKHSNVLREMIQNIGREDKGILQKQFDDERNQLEMKQIMKLEKLETINKDELCHLQNDFDSRIDQIRLDFDIKTKDIEIEFSRKREASKRDNEKNLQNNFESKLVSFKEEVKKEREYQLDAIIRSVQAEESRYKRELEMTYREERNDILKSHEALVNKLKSAISDHNERSSSDSLTLIKKESLKYTDDLQLVKISIDKSRKRIEETECEIERLGHEITAHSKGLEDEIGIEKEQRNEIQKEIDDLHTELNKITYEDEVKLILLAHDEKMATLENDVKNTILILDSDIEATELEISRYQNRLEKQKDILYQYNLLEINR